MLIGPQLRKARRLAGWTQLELAERLGLSQSRISKLERASEPIPVEFESRIRFHLRDFLEAASGGTVEFTWTPPPEPMPLPIRTLTWARSQPSGDCFWTIALPNDSLLIAALDIAGHGAEASRQALYARAWLSGWLRAFPVVPQLEACTEALRSCLAQSNVDASWYLALLIKRVEYVAEAHGFPAPLLLCDDQNVTLPSIAPPGSPPIRHVPLRPQWKLIIASDGLLERLGDGDERVGKRHLARWQLGPERRLLAPELFGPEGAGADDETLMILEWDGWDLTVEIDVSREADIERFWVLVQAWLNMNCQRDRKLVIENGLLEVIENTRIHAYSIHAPGLLRLRARLEGSHARLRIEDEGRGLVRIEGGREVRSGFDYLSATATHFDHWHRAGGGTVVSLVYAI